MHKKLAEIISKTKEDFLKRKQKVPVSVILSETKDIYSSASPQNDNSFYKFIQSTKHEAIAIIAEIKFASPTEPNLGSQDQLLELVKQYEQAGANALSVVTERHFFKGDLLFIKKIKDVASLPILQKDFVIDAFQIEESCRSGADALLLIAKIVSGSTLKRFVKLCREKGLEPVVEICSLDELAKAIESGTDIIAVNARDLDTFEVNLNKAYQLLKKVPEKFIKLGFSGIHSRTEVEKYKQAGAKGILIGTALMRAVNKKQFISSLRGPL